MPPTRKPAQSLTPDEAIRGVASPGAAPVYALLGVEGVLRDRVLHALRESLIDREFEAFNYRSVEPAGLDAGALVEEMRVIPMGGGRRVVVIEPAEALLKDQLKALGEYAADPAPSTCLVLVASEAKEGFRRAFERAMIVDCSSPWEDKIPAHLETEARSLGVRLEREAGLTLASLCGRDLSRAVAELRKAAGSVGPGGVVSASLVRSIMGGEEAGDIFKVSSALARGDAPAAVRAMRRFLETEERAELRVLYECGQHLRKLLSARSLLASGQPPREAARGVGVFWKDVDAFASQLPAWDEDRIAAAMRRLLGADRGIKKGIEDGSALIEAYLWSTLKPVQPTAARRSSTSGASKSGASASGASTSGASTSGASTSGASTGGASRG